MRAFHTDVLRNYNWKSGKAELQLRLRPAEDGMFYLRREVDDLLELLSAELTDPQLDRLTDLMTEEEEDE